MPKKKLKKPLKLFVVQMFRWGDQDAHSYIEGVYTTRRAANKHGNAERVSRAGKYEPKIWVHPLNEPRMLKYMSDEEIKARGDKAMKKIRRRHPRWFDKDGKLK